MNNNVKIGEFQCEGCGKIFASKNEWIEHRNHCDSSEEEKSDYQEETNPEEDLEEKVADEEALDENERAQSSFDETEDSEDDAEDPDEREYSKNKNTSEKQKGKRMK